MSRSSDRLQDRISRMRGGGIGGLGSGLPGFTRFEESRGQRVGLIHMAIKLLAANMLLCLGICAVSALIGAFAWPYAINEWLAVAGRPSTVEPMHGAILGLVPGLGWASPLAAAITWIAMLFLGG